MRPCVRPGRTMRYRNMEALALPVEVPILTCSRCSAEVLDAETQSILAPLLREAYQDTLRRRVRRAIDKLMPCISQYRLERLLGLSQGYLSRLRSGAGNPSSELVSHLAILAKDPRVRIEELQRYWAEADSVNPAASSMQEDSK